MVVSPSEWEWHLVFTVDTETMEVERAPKRNWRITRRRHVLLPYELPWPPPMKGTCGRDACERERRQRSR